MPLTRWIREETFEECSNLLYRSWCRDLQDDIWNLLYKYRSYSTPSQVTISNLIFQILEDNHDYFILYQTTRSQSTINTHLKCIKNHLEDIQEILEEEQLELGDEFEALFFLTNTLFLHNMYTWPDYSVLMIHSSSPSATTVFEDSSDIAHTITGLGSVEHSTDRQKFNGSSIKIIEAENPEKCVLLVHSNSTDGNQDFTDNSTYAREMYGIGSAQHETDEQYFDATSIYFPSDFDYIRMSPSSELQVQDKDFTLETWFRMGSTTSAKVLLANEQVNTAGFAWIVGSNSNYIEFRYYIPTEQRLFFYGAEAWTTDTWYHVMLARSGGDLKFFVNGEQFGSTANMGSHYIQDSSTYLKIGQSSTQACKDTYLDEIRILIDQAAQTGNFDVPTRPYDYSNSELNISLDEYLSFPENFTIDFWIRPISSFGPSAVPPPDPEAEEFTVHNMTAYNSPAPYVVTESSAYYGVYFGWKCFNGLLGDTQYWLTNSVVSGWVKIDIGSGNDKVLDYYKLQQTNTATPNRMSKDWTMEGSHNGSDWDILDTVIGETGWADEEIRTFYCDVKDTAYRYFRINVTDNNGDASYTEIGELYLYGYAADSRGGADIISSNNTETPGYLLNFIDTEIVLYQNGINILEHSHSMAQDDTTWYYIMLARENGELRLYRWCISM